MMVMLYLKGLSEPISHGLYRWHGTQVVRKSVEPLYPVGEADGRFL